MPAPPNTNPSLFLRLNHAAPAPRELAWDDFERCYAPIIGGFAARLGAKGQDIEDVVQDVLMGFFARSPTFVYDPEKGRFRGYLKVCTYRAIVKRLALNGRLPLQSMETTDEEAFAVDQAWSSVWDREVLVLALDEVRKQIGETKAFAAFEMYVVENKPAEAVATSLKMHLNSVYRAKEHVTQLLRERTAAMGDGI